MATVTNNQHTYFDTDSKHRRTTYMAATKMNSELNYLRYNTLIVYNRRLIENNNLMSKNQLDTLVRRKEDLRSLSSSDIFYKPKWVRTDSSNTTPTVQTIHSGFSDEPLTSSRDADEYSKDLQTVLNIIDSIVPDDLYIYLGTISDRNCDMGELKSKIRGNESRSSAHLSQSDNFRGNCKTFLNFLRRHYPIIGGVSKTEITINRERLLKHISENLWHQHQHILICSKSPLNVHKRKHGNYFSQFLFDEVKKLFGDENVSENAFDIRPVSSDDGNLGDAVKEVSKYASKPEFYSYFDDLSEDDVEDNRVDKFQLKAFAELRGATYNLHMKNKYDLFYDVDKFYNRLGRFKSAVKAAMANNPKYNINRRRTFGKVLTQEGLLIHTNGKKENDHWKMINFNPMDNKDFLYANRNFISHVLVSNKQLGWFNDAVHNLASKALGVKNNYYNYVIQYLDSFPFLRSVADIIDWIKSVADGKMKEAKAYLFKSNDFNCEEFHTYQMKRNDAEDLYRLIDCIKNYSDDHGVIRLGLHTNPDFKLKLYKWIQTYKGALSYLSFDVKRGWRYLGGLYNGQKDIVNEFTDEEQRTCRKAMVIADKGLDYLEVSPQPRELICLDRVGCFLSCDASDYKDKDLVPLNEDSYIDKETGEVISVIDSSNYNMLTAPSFDTYNYSKDGTDFDINLFAKINDFKTVQFDLEQGMNSFSKSSINASLSKAKKMANA